MNDLSISLPSTWLARDVWLRIAKSGSRWVIESEDRNGMILDVRLSGYTGVVRFVTKAAATDHLAKCGYQPGDKVFAEPSK
jgi:hypothetical protein